MYYGVIFQPHMWNMLEVGNWALWRQNDWYAYVLTVCVFHHGWVGWALRRVEFGQLKEFLTGFFVSWKTPIRINSGSKHRERVQKRHLISSNPFPCVWIISLWQSHTRWSVLPSHSLQSAISVFPFFKIFLLHLLLFKAPYVCKCLSSKLTQRLPSALISGRGDLIIKHKLIRTQRIPKVLTSNTVVLLNLINVALRHGHSCMQHWATHIFLSNFTKPSLKSSYTITTSMS